MQRPTTNYFEKSMGLILQFTKLIFVILYRFSISPLSAGRNHLPGTDRSLELVPVPMLQLELGAEVPAGWGNWNSHQGLRAHEGSPVVLQQLWDWEFSVTKAPLPPSGFTLAVLGLLTEL